MPVPQSSKWRQEGYNIEVAREPIIFQGVSGNSFRSPSLTVSLSGP